MFTAEQIISRYRKNVRELVRELVPGTLHFKTNCFKSILNGTYQQLMDEYSDIVEEEIIAAEVTCKAESGVAPISIAEQLSDAQIDAALAQVNKQLERYTFDGCKADYALGIISGLYAGVIDSVFVGATTFDGMDLALSHQQVNNFIEKYVVGVMERFSAYRAALEERVSNYLAEDIKAFLTGFDYMKQGMESGDSDLMIRGNVVIQRVLGREPQFTNQREFDDLMDSDEALIL